MNQSSTPVVFVHGLWLHATSWNPWIQAFHDAGYDASAPGWPGEPETVQDARDNPALVAGSGIDAIVEHYAQHIAALSAKPIVIGHSFGGLIAQRLLGEQVAAAAVAIDAAPIRGVLYLPPSALRVASIALRNPTNRNRSVALDAGQFRYGFGNAISEEESQALFDKWTVPSPARPLFEAAAAALNPRSPARVATGNSARGPLLLIAGGKDHTVPASITHQTTRLYRSSPARTECHEFADRGHSLVLDSGWREIADYSLGWLRDQKV
jgi:non-heme chloroperoxidase